MPGRRRGTEWAIARRLAIQRISSAPLETATDVVRHLTCVQSQELTYAPYSLGLRVRKASQGSVLDELSDGRFVRTHILRPTWHYVAAEDLRWIQAATAPRVLTAMRGRHRQLKIDDALVSATEKTLTQLLAERPLTRREITAELSARGAELSGERLGHTLMILELRSLICSGPMAGTVHTYQLVDDLAGANAERVLAPDEALRELAHRFFRGHGPASRDDFARWASLTKKQASSAIADAADVLETVEAAGTELYVDPTYSPRKSRRPDTMLLPLFDEAFLTSPGLQFERPHDHPLTDERDVWMGPNPGAGIVLHESRNVGAWSRQLSGSTVAIRHRLAPSLTDTDRAAIDDATQRYAQFLDRPLDPSPTTAGPSPRTTDPSPTATDPSPTTAGPSPTTAGPSPTTAGPSPTTAGPSPTARRG